jgi:hypothetical protein
MQCNISGSFVLTRIGTKGRGNLLIEHARDTEQWFFLQNSTGVPAVRDWQLILQFHSPTLQRSGLPRSLTTYIRKFHNRGHMIERY